MKVELAPELENYLAEQVSSGRFASANEVVVDALRRMIAKQQAEHSSAVPSQPRDDAAAEAPLSG